MRNLFSIISLLSLVGCAVVPMNHTPIIVSPVVSPVVVSPVVVYHPFQFRYYHRYHGYGWRRY